MNATMKRVTKESVLAAARKKWGPKVQLSEDPRAPTPAQKEQSRVRYAEIVARVNDIKAELAGKTEGNMLRKLAAAAAFARDVDGDEPSWSQLVEATREVEAFLALMEERASLNAEKDKLPRTYATRWDVAEVVSVAGLPMSHVRAHADTLEELMAKITGSAE